MKVFFYTKRGLVPHMSQGAPETLQVSLPHVYALSGVGKGAIDLATYLGFRACDVLLSIKDTLKPKSIAGNSDHDRIRVISPQEVSLTVEDYMKFAAKSGFRRVVSFSEEAPGAAGHHRAQRSAKQAAETVSKCVELKAEGMLLYGNIQGGRSVAERLRCTKAIKAAPVDGIIHSGYYIGGLYVDEDPKVVKDIIQFVCAELRDDGKPILLSGVGKPADLVLAAREGVTEFECAYPFTMAQEGKAIILPLPTTFPDCSSLPDADPEQDYTAQELDLKDNAHAQTVSPLSEGCACYACRRHSRAYVHHLVACEELTGTALLTM